MIEVQSNNTKILIPNKFTEDLKLNLNDIQTKNISSLLFPDKIKNLNKYSLNVTFSDSDIFSTVSKNGEWVDFYSYFVDIIRQKLNASIKCVQLIKNFQNWTEFFGKYDEEMKPLVLSLQLDLSIISRIRHITPGQVVLMYETMDTCILAFLPPSISIHEQILFRPLEPQTWIYLGATFVVFICVWRMFKNFGADDSHWHFMFVVIGYFLGHSVGIKM